MNQRKKSSTKGNVIQDAGKKEAHPVSDIALLPLYNVVAGLDVHESSIVACVLGCVGNEEFYEIRPFGTFKNHIESLGSWLLECNVEHAAIESTGVYWRNPYYLLKESGLDLILTNAWVARNAPGRKTDYGDSRWLAMLTRAGLLTKSRVLSREDDGLREMSRLRQKYVDGQSGYKNRVYKLLVKAGFNVSQVVTDLFGKTGQIIIDGLINERSPEQILLKIELTLGYRLKAPREKLLNALRGTTSSDLKYEIQTLLDSISHFGKNIERLEATLEKRLIDRGFEVELKLLQTMPGVSKVAAMTLLVELGGDLTDFRTAQALASWAGMCPGNNESAGKRKSGKTRHGNSYLRRILCEIAAAAARTNCYFREKYKNLVPRRGTKKARVAIGHKILKVAYHMLTRVEPYKDLTVDYEELVTKKNAARWIRKLRKYNLLKETEPA